MARCQRVLGGSEMWLCVGVVFLNAVFVQAVSGRHSAYSNLLDAVVGPDGGFLPLRRWFPSFMRSSEAASQQGIKQPAKIIREHRKALTSVLLSQTPDGAVPVTVVKEGGSADTATFSMTGLPATEMVQEGASITEAEWPANFCVNVQVEAPDASDVSSGTIKAIALIGGEGESGGGTGRCGYFFLCFSTGNTVAMGVQCNGGGSDPPLGTSQNLTSFSQHDVSFCYDSTSLQATIFVDGAMQASASKVFVFPREGQVSLLTGSHDTDVELTEGVTLTSLRILRMTTTTTTTTSYQSTSYGFGTNLQNAPFALQAMPRTTAGQRTAMITQQEWPPDFCINVVITTPATVMGIRAIALLGGTGHCGNFMLFFGDQNKAGMGVQCDTAGSDPALVTAASVPGGTHALTFCYAKIEGKASISIDGVIMTSDDRDWNYPMFGNVSVLVGSHVNETEMLKDVTLSSLSMVQHNPLAPVPVPTDGSGHTDLNMGTLAPKEMDVSTTSKLNETELRNRLNGSNGSWPGGNGSDSDGNGTGGHRIILLNTTVAPTAEPSTTTTATTSIIMEHILQISNWTNQTTNDSSHSHNSYRSEHHDDYSSSYQHHTEGR